MLSRLLARLRARFRTRAGDGRDRYGDDSGGDDSGADDGSVWDAIPSWQYTGLHVESGGFTRDEQERALGDVRRRAETMDAVDDDRR
ncbi:MULTISPECIES: hypothetical protein [Halorussus]|uniref:hypothetical protein n=1 Tax=Halorussus TaxID=1070314 RepID=UPI000E20CB81|nr:MULTISPECIES: hypothetical protein [Halorussus]NHN58699.1 hypothetical protein [Halorussus sp. JP-T4]